MAAGNTVAVGGSPEGAGHRQAAGGKVVAWHSPGEVGGAARMEHRADSNPVEEAGPAVEEAGPAAGVVGLPAVGKAGPAAEWVELAGPLEEVVV